MPVIYDGSNAKFIKVGNLPYGKPYTIVWISKKLFNWISKVKTPDPYGIYDLFPLQRGLLVETDKGNWVLVYDEGYWTGDIFMRSYYGKKVDTYVITPEPVSKLEYLAYMGDREDVGVSKGLLVSFSNDVDKVNVRYRLKGVNSSKFEREEWKSLWLYRDGRVTLEEDLGDDDMLARLVFEE